MIRAAMFFLATILFLTCWSSQRAEAQVMRRLEFRPTNQEFLNPERGFYRYRSLTNTSNYAEVRGQGQSIIYGRVDAREFRDAPLSNEFLAKIQAGFNEARRQGLKVKFRLAYNDGFDPDAPKDVILGHIQQLGPVWEKNKDVLFHMDAGFIGAWGEWHASTNGLDNKIDRRDILFAILAALPSDRTVGIRTPHFKREAFTGSQQSATEIITSENAFDGSPLTRVGHLNDCFLSSPEDVGTYVLLTNNWPLERELDYIGSESRYVPFGGETCALDDRSKSANAISEMAQLHIDYLNLDYHPDVIQRWKDEGTFDEIQRRLGYRFELKSGELPESARPGGIFPLKLTIANVGFGELFNARQLEISLTHNATGTMMSTPLDLDPRRWSGGTTSEISTWLTVPATLPTGEYSVGIWMPDIEPSLRSDVRYSVRFANEGVWDEATGINTLTSSFLIVDSARGSVYDGTTEFREVADPSMLNLRGDFNQDGRLDAIDIDTLTAAVGLNESPFDLNLDGTVDDQDRAHWVLTLAATHFGDTNLDGMVDFADFLVLASGYGAGGGWSHGNFDTDQVVSFSDFLLLAANFDKASRGTLMVPEPADFGWLILPASAHLVRRRRGSQRRRRCRQLRLESLSCRRAIAFGKRQECVIV